MKEINVKVYDYKELTERAKKMAQAEVREAYSEAWYDMESYDIECMAGDVLEEDFSLKNVSVDNVYYDTFTQGSYFSVKGCFDINPDMKISKNDSIMKAFEGFTIELRPNKFDSFIENEEEIFEFAEEEGFDFNDTEDFINEIEEYLREIYGQMLGRIENIFLDIESEEYLIGFLEGMEIYFLENGHIFEV